MSAAVAWLPLHQPQQTALGAPRQRQVGQRQARTHSAYLHPMKEHPTGIAHTLPFKFLEQQVNKAFVLFFQRFERDI